MFYPTNILHDYQEWLAITRYTRKAFEAALLWANQKTIAKNHS